MSTGTPSSAHSAVTPAPVAPAAVEVTVIARRPLTDRVDEFTLAATDGSQLPGWTPGSHIDLVLGSPGVRERLVRQYSLCSDPADLSTYTVAIDRHRDGRGGSQYAHDTLAVGATLTISAPRNHFQLTRALHYVFVAGGIGITPMVPLIAQAQAASRPWRLIYVAKTRADMAYLDELTQLYGEQMSVHESAHDGRLDLAESLSDLPRGTAVYVCGPATMIADVEAACADQVAVDAFFERFTVVDTGDRVNQPFEVALAYSGDTLTVPANKSILEVLEDNGVLAPSSCREGMCGTCEVGVVSGELDHRDSVLTPEEQSENESMMVCVSRCTSGRLVLEL